MPRIVRLATGGCLLLALLMLAPSAPTRAQEDKAKKDLAKLKFHDDMRATSHKLGHFDNAVTYGETALELARELYGPDDIKTAMRMNNLAIEYKALKRTGLAETLFQGCLKIFELKLSPDDPNLAIAINNLANIYAGQKRFNRAEPLYLRALKLREEKFGKSHEAVADSLRGLGVMYRQQKAYVKAEPLLLRSKAIREERSGKDSAPYADIIHELGVLYRDQEEWAKAEALLQEVLKFRDVKLAAEMAKSSLERNDSVARPVLETLNVLGDVCLARKDYASAEAHKKRVLEILQRNRRSEPLDVAAALGQLAKIYQVQGEYAKAEPLLLQSLPIRVEKQGNKHADFFADIDLLIECWKTDKTPHQVSLKPVAVVEAVAEREAAERRAAQGDLAAGKPEHALGHLETAIAIRRHRSSEAELDPFSTKDLGRIQAALGHHDKAEALFLESIARFKPGHPEIQRTRELLVQLYVDTKQFDKAKGLYADLLSARDDSRNPTSLDLAKLLAKMGTLHRTIGENDRADPFFDRARSIFEARLNDPMQARFEKEGLFSNVLSECRALIDTSKVVFGPDSPHTAAILQKLGNLEWRVSGKHDAAEANLQKALEIFEVKQGKDHPDVAAVLEDLATVFRIKGDAAKAEPMLVRVLQIREAKLGDENTALTLTLDALASLARGQGKPDQAKSIQERIRKIWDKSFGPAGADAAPWLEQAERFRIAGRIHLARTLAERGLELRVGRHGESHLETTAAKLMVAAVARDEGDISRARDLLKQCLEVRESQLGLDHLDTAAVVDELGDLHRRLGEHDRARTLLQRGLHIREAKLGKDAAGVVPSLLHLAAVSDPDTAYALLRRAEACLRGKPEQTSLMASECYATLLDHLRNRVEPRPIVRGKKDSPMTAEELFAQALKIELAHRDQTHPAVAVVLDSYRPSLDKLRFRLACQEERFAVDHPDVADTLDRLADEVLRKARDHSLSVRVFVQPSTALPYISRSLRIREKRLGKDHPDVASSLDREAEVWMSQGIHEKAEPALTRSLGIREASLGKDHHDLIRTLLPLAEIARKRGDQDRTEGLLERSLKIGEARLGKDHFGLVPVLDQLAAFHLERGAFDKAEPYCLRSHAIWEARLGKVAPRTDPARSASFENLGVLRESQGKYREAVDFFMKTDRFADVARLERSFNFSVEEGGAVTSMNIARNRARDYVLQTLATLPEADQLKYLKNREEEDFHLCLSMATQGRPDDLRMNQASLAWLFKGKAVAHRALAARNLSARAAADPEVARLTDELADIREQLAGLIRIGGAAPQQLASELKQREEQLSSTLALKVNPEDQLKSRLTREVLLASVPKDTAVVDIVRFRVFNFKARGAEPKWQPPRYFAWVLTNTVSGLNYLQVKVVDLGDAEAIDRAVQAFQKSIHQAGRIIYDEGEADAEKILRTDSQALADLVLKPLMPHIGKSSRWLISPDSALWLVPWAALPLDERHYVIEKHEIRYLVSGRDINPIESPISSNPALVVANPDFNLDPARAAVQAQSLKIASAVLPGSERSSRDRIPTDWSPLPGTAKEAELITPNLTEYLAAAPQLYRESAALEGVVKSSPSPRVLILSTHGFFLADQPGSGAAVLENPLLRCGLVFAGANVRGQKAAGNQDDGLLTGLEIVGLDLRGTELVVLSACDTGLGEIRNGEGVAGLRQAFQLAGAQSVIASLWKVPDAETAQLMDRFWNNTASGLSHSRALHEAQIACILERRSGKSRASHPYFWAAFTLTGR